MTTSTTERLELAVQVVESVALSGLLRSRLDVERHGEPMAAAQDFFERLGVHGSIGALYKTYADYRTTRLRLEAAGLPGPSVDVARGIEELLAVCREVRSTWPADKVAEWARLVDSGMAPATAREAVILIHACPRKQMAPRPPRIAGRCWGRGLGRTITQSVQLAVERLLGRAGGDRWPS